MSNFPFIASVLFSVCLAVAASAPASAAETSPPKTEVKIIKQVDRTEVQITQQAERMEARNRIMVRLMVEAKGSNARQIQLDINKRMTAAIQKAQANPAITVETASYSVNRPYNPQLDKEADRWRGMQILSLTSDDFDAVLALAGELQGDGLVMNDMRFFVAAETLKAAQDELTTAALQRLKERTAHVANDLGLRVERYKSIYVSNATEEYGDTGRRNGKAVATTAGKAAPPAVVAGNALVTLQVSATVIMMQ